MRGEAGFSLVEVTIAIAIMGVGMLALTTMMTNSQKGARGLAQWVSATDVEVQLSRALQDENNCTASLKGLPFNHVDLASASIPDVKIQTPGLATSYVAKVGDELSPGLKITSMTIKDFQSTGSSKYVANLEVVATRTSGTAMGAPTITKTFPLQITSVPYGFGPFWTLKYSRIGTCAYVSSQQETNCKSQGGHWEPANTPPCIIKPEFVYHDWKDGGFEYKVTEDVFSHTPDNYYIVGMSSYFYTDVKNVYTDRKFQFTYALPGNESGTFKAFGTCYMPDVYYLNDLGDPITFECPANMWLRGELSHWTFKNNPNWWGGFDSYDSDRQFNYECCTMYDRNNGNSIPLLRARCEWSGLVSGLGKSIDYACPSGKLMAGVQSFWDADKDDRTYSYLCCAYDYPY